MVSNRLEWREWREGDPMGERQKQRNNMNLTIFFEETEDGKFICHLSKNISFWIRGKCVRFWNSASVFKSLNSTWTVTCVPPWMAVCPPDFSVLSFLSADALHLLIFEEKRWTERHKLGFHWGKNFRKSSRSLKAIPFDQCLARILVWLLPQMPAATASPTLQAFNLEVSCEASYKLFVSLSTCLGLGAVSRDG